MTVYHGWTQVRTDEMFAIRRKNRELQERIERLERKVGAANDLAEAAVNVWNGNQHDLDEDTKEQLRRAIYEYQLVSDE